MAILPHPTTLQPIGIPIVDRGHPLGAHLLAGWIMNSNDYPMEIVRQRRATDSFGSGPSYNPSSAGGATNSSSTSGTGDGLTVFTNGQNVHLDKVGLAPHSVVARGKMLDTTKARGWIIRSNTWAIGQLTDTFNYQCFALRDVSTAAATLVNGRVYTVGASNNLGTVYLYVNGVQKTSGNGGLSQTATDPWEIGDFTGSGERWEGTVEYVYVFDKMLSASEHMWIHQNPYGMFMQPALSRWFEYISAPPVTAAVTGTVLNALETDIVAGGKTIILTLTNDTWVASGATFDAQRQAIINGLVAAQGESGGWNAVVQTTQGVAGVVRTDSTTVTITLDAFPSYLITGNEYVTTTIPGAALSGGSAIVASPIFEIFDVGPAYNFLRGTR